MNSVIDDPSLHGPGFPIQKSPDLSLFSSSPKLIAANHVFHRLLAPRHPPYALSSLTINNYSLKFLLSFSTNLIKKLFLRYAIVKELKHRLYRR